MFFLKLYCHALLWLLSVFLCVFIDRHFIESVMLANIKSDSNPGHSFIGEKQDICWTASLCVWTVSTWHHGFKISEIQNLVFLLIFLDKILDFYSFSLLKHPGKQHAYQ